MEAVVDIPAGHEVITLSTTRTAGCGTVCPVVREHGWVTLILHGLKNHFDLRQIICVLPKANRKLRKNV